MKNLFRIIFVISFASKIDAGFSQETGQSQESISSQMFLSSPFQEKDKKSFKNLNGSMQSNPLCGILDKNDPENKDLPSSKIHQGIKAAVPSKVPPMFQHSKLSILKHNPEQFKNYPTGAELFAKYPDLSSKFDAMISSFLKEPDFIPLFRKIHINVLNELYHYLIGIFMNFNLQHQGMIQNESTGDLMSDIPTFLQTETKYDINKKTMIINHLMSVIQSQFNGAIQSYVPYIPQSFATYIGRIAIQNDYSTDLTHLIVEQMEPELAKLKTSSLQALANYVSFFQAMTEYLNKKNTKTSMHFHSFVDIATQVNTFLYADKKGNQALLEKMKANSPAAYFKADTAGAAQIKISKESAESWAKGMPYPKDASTAPLKNSHIIHNDAHLIALAKMNPPLFHFGYDDIRALKLIPYLSKKINSSSSPVPWPDHIVQAANEMFVLKSDNGPHPIAYFKTKDNKMVKNYSNKAKDSDLYICMRLGHNLFEQILIYEPEWLSSWEGILKILKACYGDFTAILGMDILDPVTEAVIANVVKIQTGKEPTSMKTITQKAKNLINSWKNINTKTEQKTGANLSDLPPLSSNDNSQLPGLELPSINNVTINNSSLETPSLVSQP